VPRSRINRFTPAARRAAIEARVASADERAANLALILKETRAAGITTLNGTPRALNARGVRTPAGHRHWYASQVAQLLARLPAQPRVQFCTDWPLR
jgi:hypothetical protein